MDNAFLDEDDDDYLEEPPPPPPQRGRRAVYGNPGNPFVEMDEAEQEDGDETSVRWRNGERVQVSKESLMFGDDENPALWQRAAEMEAKRAPQRKAKAKAKAKATPPPPPPPPPLPSPAPKAKAKAKAKKAQPKKAKTPAPDLDELVIAEPVYEEEPLLPLSVAEQTNQALGRRLNDVRGGGLTIKKADFTVNSLMDKIRRGKLDLRPSYQREYVWDNRTASKLIESLLLNVPIPTLFFHEVRNGVLEVVDGKQRLTSVWSFIQEEFPDLEPFRLSGLEVFEELNGAAFSDLNDIQQEIIKDYAMSVHTIAHQSNPEFVFEVFERLNMGSTQLNEQELRNCIYQGPYTNLLGELASDPNLLKINRSQGPHIRMKDREQILRFFAMMRSTPYQFYSPVKNWLNKEIRDHKNLPLPVYEEMEALFQDCVQVAWEIFGETAFRMVKSVSDEGVLEFEGGEVNTALWDTVMYSFVDRDPEVLLENKEAIRDAFYQLLMDGSITKRLMVSTPKAVIARHELWDPLLADVLGEDFEEEEAEEEGDT